MAVDSINRLKMFQEAGKIFSAKLNYRKTFPSLEDLDVISVVNECAIKFIACVAGAMRERAKPQGSDQLESSLATLVTVHD